MIDTLPFFMLACLAVSFLVIFKLVLHRPSKRTPDIHVRRHLPQIEADVDFMRYMAFTECDGRQTSAREVVPGVGFSLDISTEGEALLLICTAENQFFAEDLVFWLGDIRALRFQVLVFTSERYRKWIPVPEA